MIRTINSAERRIFPKPYTPITLDANTAKDVIEDQLKQPHTEIAYRYVQNVGSGIVLYKFGADCSVQNFDGVIAPAPSVDANGYGAGGQLDCSNHRLRVSCLSVAGSTVTVTVLLRNDQGQNNSYITP